jgi:anti-sigma B factor antagonist
VRYNGPVSNAKSALTVDEIGESAGATVLAVVGELDLATIGVLKNTVGVRLDSESSVVLDLSGLEFCDSTGLGAFVALHRQATTSGARFALARPNKRIADLFSLSGIDQVVPVFTTLDAATATAVGDSAG